MIDLSVKIERTGGLHHVYLAHLHSFNLYNFSSSLVFVGSESGDMASIADVVIV